MSHTYKILEAEIVQDHVDNREMLDVSVQVYKNKKKTEVRRFGFELETTEKAIRAELDRVVACLDDDAAQAAKNAEHEKRQKIAKGTIKKLTKGSKK